MESKNKIQPYYPWIAFFLTLLTAYMAFSCGELLSNGRYTVMYGDLFSQYVPFSKLLVEKLRTLDFSWYSFHVSLGQNMALIYAYYSFSPFNIFYLLIPDTLVATELMLIFRIASSAGCFCFMLQRGFQRVGVENIFFSICYGMCAFQIEYLQMNDALYLFPIVIYMLLRFMETKKMSGLLWSYAAAFVIHFYTGYLVGVFSFLSFLILLIHRDGENFARKNRGLILRYVCLVVSAICISMLVLFPAIMQFMENPSWLDGEGVKRVLLPTDLYHSMFMGYPITFNGAIPYLYCGLPVLLLLPFYFLNQQISKKERIFAAGILVTFVLSFFIEPVYLFLHCFNNPDGYTARYACYMVFFLVLLAWKQSRYLEEISLKNAVILILINVVFYFTGYELNRLAFQSATLYIDWFTVFFNILFMACWGSWFWLKRRNRIERKSLLLLLLIIGMVECGWNSCWLLRQLPVVKEDSYRTWENGTENTLQNLRNEDSGIYRIHFADEWLDNQQTYYGYYGIGEYSTFRNSSLDSVMFHLGDSVSAMGYYQLGATPVTDMLFGIRYYAYQESFQRNPYALEWGYMVSNDILKDMVFLDNVFENQNQLLSAMTGVQQSVFVSKDVDEIVENGMYLDIAEDGTKHFGNLTGNSVGELQYWINANDYSRAYAYFSMTKPRTEGAQIEAHTVQQSDYDVLIYSDADPYLHRVRNRYLATPAIIRMKKEGEQFEVSLINYNAGNTEYWYENLLLAYLEEQELESAYGVLASNQWTVEELREGEIKAFVEVTPDKPILFMSIPYDRNWHALVDGEEMPVIELVDGAFMGLELKPGYHIISMKYVASGVVEGLWIFAVGILLAIFAMVWDIRLDCKDKRNSECVN